MDVGTIFLHKSFEFLDGTKKDKFLILVNSPKNTEDYLFCLTTSQEKPPYRERKPGCHSEQGNYMLASNEDWFEKDTWIQFDEIYDFNQAEMLKKSLSDKILEEKDQLNLKNVKALLSCILKSKNLDEDYLDLIEKAVKELEESP